MLTVLCAGVFFTAVYEAYAADAPKSKPVITHRAQEYEFNYSREKGKQLFNKTTGTFYASWNDMPILFPGDKVTIIPDTPTEAKALENSNVSSGTYGVVFSDCTAETRGPVKVTASVDMGEPILEGYGKTFIQGFEITGTEPVMIVCNEWGGYTSKLVEVSSGDTSVQVTLNYLADRISFKYYPAYVNLEFQYVNENGEQLNKKEVHYYGEAENPDVIWAVDAINNLNSTNRVKLIVNLPYIEGYRLSDIETQKYSKGYDKPGIGKFNDNGTMEITPLWEDTERLISAGNAFSLNGDYTYDWTAVVYYLQVSRTLTLDACGGEINGAEIRIYNMDTGDTIYTGLDSDQKKGVYTPVWEGHDFLGWYLDKEYTKPAESIKKAVDAYKSDSYSRDERCCRLYARWKETPNGWVEEDGVKRYYSSGDMVKGSCLISGYWYYFDADGIMQTGWITIDGHKYYYDADGKMVTGKHTIDGKVYNFDEHGILQEDNPGSNPVDPDIPDPDSKYGWTVIGGKTYFLDEKGNKVTGWLSDNGKIYYLDKDGVLCTGWQKAGQDWYYLGKDGVLQTGWKKIGGKWYFFDKDGVMQTGWKKSSGKWYYLNTSGAMCTGWKKVSGKWYYFNAGGVMKTGWLKDNGKWYYLNTSGAMCIGWKKISGEWYYFDTKGVMKTGWMKDGQKWYYLSGGGIMVTGTREIGGKEYNFSNAGVCLNP